MYKLIVNGIQIGNYKSLKNLISVAFAMEVIKNGLKSAIWKSNREFWVTTK